MLCDPDHTCLCSTPIFSCPTGLSSTPVLSIAKICGRARGIGSEFVLACDMRFASRQSAVFGEPEIRVGLVPGGSALEWLPRLVGRARALEVVLSGDDCDAERDGWLNRTLDGGGPFVDVLIRRSASFDPEALAACRQLPSFQSSIELRFRLLVLQGAQASRVKTRNIWSRC